MLKAIVFDCDGVLFDSGPANIAFFNHVLRTMGRAQLDKKGEVLARFMTSSQLLNQIFGGDNTLVTEGRRIAEATDYRPFYHLMEPVSDLYGTLTRLSDNYKLGMASNRGKTVPEVVNRFQLGKHFDIAVGTLDVENPKPAPDMLLLCAERFGISPEEMLYVGDATSDFAAASAANAPFVGIGEGTGSKFWIVELKDLEDVLDQFAAL